jgi:hypothetical protein
MTVAEAGTVHATPNLNKALSQLQGELPKVTKSNTADIPGREGRQGFKYSYADLADVTAAVGPLLAKYGLAFHAAPSINPADRQEMILTWSLLHESGEERGGEWPLGPVSTPPQTLGSRITYGRRYCLGSATGIVAEDDDDGQRAQKDDSPQSAGALWEKSAPARPRQDRAAQLLAEAAALTTDAAAGRIARVTDDARTQGHITRDQADHIQNRIRLRLAALRETARPAEAEDLGRLAAADPARPAAPAAASPATGSSTAPDANGRPEPAETDYDTPGTAGVPQITAIWTVLSTVFGFGRDEKDQARAVCAHIIGHPLESTKNMSRNEAGAVLDALAGWRETAERHEEQPREFLIELLATAEKGGGDG